MNYQRHIPESELAALQMELLLEHVSRAGFLTHLSAVAVAAALVWPYLSAPAFTLWASIGVTLLALRQFCILKALAQKRMLTNYRGVYRSSMMCAFVFGAYWAATFIYAAASGILPYEPLLFLFVVITTVVGAHIALAVVVQEYFLVYMCSSVAPVGMYLLLASGGHYYFTFAGVLAVLFCVSMARVSTHVHKNFVSVLKSDWERENLSRDLGHLTHSLRERNRELSDVQRKLTELTMIDELTGLGNRRMVDAAVATELSRAQRNGTALSLIILDVDHFKKYNDAYGHPEGDRVLKTLANLIRRVVSRAGEVAARYGGEEFLLVLPGSDANAAIAVAKRLQKLLALEAIAHKGAESHSVVTLSQGIATFNGNAEECAERLIKAADMALYEAKQRGRNRIVCGDRDVA